MAPASKKKSTSKKFEPSLRDVWNVVQLIKERADSTETRLESVHKEVSGLSTRMDSMHKEVSGLSTRVDSMHKAVQSTHDRVNLIDTRLITVERSVGKLTAKVEDIQDDLTSALAAFDTDSVRVLDHEKRIVRLEKRALRV